MWYKFAQQKFNIYGLPISGDYRQIKEFAGENELDDLDNDGIEDIELEEPENPIEDPTIQDEVTPEDIAANIEALETDPTANLKLPPLHSNCHCYIETLPILSQTGAQDGRRVWKKAENCCPVCEMSAKAFNDAELQRLSNFGIDVNTITR